MFGGLDSYVNYGEPLQPNSLVVLSQIKLVIGQHCSSIWFIYLKFVHGKLRLTLMLATFPVFVHFSALLVIHSFIEMGESYGNICQSKKKVSCYNVTFPSSRDQPRGDVNVTDFEVHHLVGWKLGLIWTFFKQVTLTLAAS